MGSGPGTTARSIADDLSQHGEVTITDWRRHRRQQGRQLRCHRGRPVRGPGRPEPDVPGRKVQRRSVTGPKTAVFHYARADAEPDGEAG